MTDQSSEPASALSARSTRIIFSKDRRCFARVDSADYERLSKYSWYCDRRGYFYSEDGSMHRMVLGLVPSDGKVADHIDHNTGNNTRANLRAVTPLENARNRRRRSRPAVRHYRCPGRPLKGIGLSQPVPNPLCPPRTVRTRRPGPLGAMSPNESTQ